MLNNFIVINLSKYKTKIYSLFLVNKTHDIKNLFQKETSRCFNVKASSHWSMSLMYYKTNFYVTFLPMCRIHIIL